MNRNRIHKAIIALTAALLLPPCPTLAQDASRNYVRTVTMLDAAGTDSVQAVQYYNGLGWPTVYVATAGADGGTACVLTAYDALGREKRRYAPVPGDGLAYMAESAVSSSGYGFYEDNTCFTQSHYDALDRVTAADIAGDAWAQEGKKDRTAYLANTSADMVLHYEAPEDGSDELTYPEDTDFQYYPAGSLRKTVSLDADSVCVTVFTDLTGKKILERTFAGDTYYVYNELGQLRFVLTPAFEKISRSNTMFAYEYRYDDRGRVVEKILPGDGSAGVTVRCRYDRADRVAFMKDPSLGYRYRFYLYDRLGRLCVQGTCSNSYGQCGSRLATATYASGSQGICQTGYIAPYAISDPQLEIVNYYDNYDFIGNHMTDAMPAVNINPDQEEHAAGSLTGQAVLTTGGDALGAISVYDRKGQVVRSVRKGLNGHVEDVRTSYTFTGAVDTVRVNVSVGYGGSFTANTVNAYGKGKKTGMTLSVSHGLPAVSRQTEYTYDAVGRLSAKERQLTGTVTSPCTFSYDVHGWLTGVTSGGFEERLHYADGIGGGRWNGNVSTMRWKCTGDSVFQGYDLTYDGANRLCGAVYGTGTNLTGLRGRFSEYADYDCNGNVTWLRRGGLTNNLRESYGLVDALRMTYEGNRLVSVRDSVYHIPYAGASDFTGLLGQENPLTYDDAGSLFSDVGRRIARIDYDPRNNPVRIQFTDGSVTGYIYSAAGEKLRVIHQTAVPNISVPVGFIRPLAPSEILSADSTDYLLGGALTLKNGLIDKYLFEEGYCQATVYGSRPGKDSFAFYYYDRDHLGSVREVTRAFECINIGTAYLRTDYYPSGLRLCDGTADSGTQPYKYNGKELDGMHGLCTYDYGARQYDPVTARWDRTDPLCEKYYGISPYAYCRDNPVINVDPDGRFVLSKEQAKKYPRLNLYLQKGIQGILNNPRIMHALRVAGRFTNKQIKEMLTYGKGPIVNVTPLMDIEDGKFKPNEKSNILNINESTVNWLESAEGLEADVALFFIGVTILHEFAHYGDDLSGNPDKNREDGEVFEELAYGKKVNRIDAWLMVSKYIHKFDNNKSNNNKKNDQETKEKDDESY